MIPAPLDQENTRPSDKSRCFVVMPFGKKPFPDGSGRTYDFNKVYEFLIQRAIRQAGMEPIRADEHVGSSLIHTDMFKDLRDQPVVLADLSLGNPNVFYELGIRHVMSNTGTVLICNQETVLPFDVQLSRVVFYEYDGQYLDWGVVERKVIELQRALQEAQRGKPDSPVHALLETVIRESRVPATSTALLTKDNRRADALVEFQELVAAYWIDRQEALADLKVEHWDTVFGSRALGYYCLHQLKKNKVPKDAAVIAAHLTDAQQFALANEIFRRLKKKNKLSYKYLLRYASSYSEAYPDLQGALDAIVLADEAFHMIKSEYDSTTAHLSLEASGAYGYYYRHRAGLEQWKWQNTRKQEDLEHAITLYQRELQHLKQARALGSYMYLGYIAHAHLKLLLLLRLRDSLERPDTEGHLDAILKLKPRSPDNPHGPDDPRAVSDMRWAQVLAMADLGMAHRLEEAAIKAIAEDAKIDASRYWEIGRRQYVRLRRFLEQYAPALRNPPLMGRISQYLQYSYKDE